MDADEVHRAVIDVLVVQAAASCATFAELLGRLPGAPPDEAASALDRLASLGLVDPAAAARLAPSAQPVLASEDDEYLDTLLPPPHPLVYDWRFTLATAESLRSCCVQLSRSGDTIALLGTPTVLSAAALTPQGRRWVLLESSPATTDALTRIAPDVLQCDLSCDDLPSLDARVVVADPPWYAENTSVFLWAASRLSRVGATVLLAQPPLATRPGILAEDASLLAFARHTGLELETIRHGVLAYPFTHFE